MRYVLFSALVSAVVSAGTTVAMNKFVFSKELVDVPQVMNLPLATARSLVESKGLLLLVSEEKEDGKVVPGTIVGQRPLDGSKVAKGESLAVVVSKPLSAVRVPDLVGKPVADAKARLESAKLAMGKLTEVADEKAAPGQIVAQIPLPGAEVSVGYAMDLSVSAGPPKLPVPNVVGRGMAKAKDELQKAGFTVGAVKTKSDDDRSDGIILEQVPAAGQPAPKGSAVELVLNRT